MLQYFQSITIFNKRMCIGIMKRTIILVPVVGLAGLLFAIFLKSYVIETGSRK